VRKTEDRGQKTDYREQTADNRQTEDRKKAGRPKLAIRIHPCPEEALYHNAPLF
jgi:hypothetical protein